MQVIKEARRISGVAGLCVDDNYIYYSCAEVNEARNEKKFILRKCQYDGKVVKPFHCPCFVRGIGQSKGFLYILVSRADSMVVKLDRNFQIVKATREQYSVYLGEAFGMLVTSENVLVCSERHSLICVFDLNLGFCYNLPLRFHPIAIAKFQDHFIVISEATVSVIDIDFERKTLKVVTNMSNVGSVPLNPGVVLRGLCCSDKYIYVTKKARHESPGLPILCLQYDKIRFTLNYVCEADDFPLNCDSECSKCCGPVVLYCHKNKIFYSQGCYGEKFHVVEATHNPGEPITSKKLFDVC